MKEVTALKRKLEQVSQFGCEAFALLFDDIESEMSKSDKEVFQSFAHAQVTITNDVFNHLNSPTFLFCPTQYCSTRAVPNVTQSEYLNTIGTKLESTIDILWTGQKVITKLLTTESIQEITEVLKRRPVIWDNLHANDYDQKRVFLGPYSGRSVELIPLLGGVVTNPNCEFHANTIAIHTLAHWSKCNSDTKINNDSISADIKLEIENEDGLEDGPVYLAKNAYHPRRALKNAILDWYPEFFIHKEVTGKITKPHPQVTSKFYCFSYHQLNQILMLSLSNSGDADYSNNSIIKYLYELTNNNNFNNNNHIVFKCSRGEYNTIASIRRCL